MKLVIPYILLTACLAFMAQSFIAIGIQNVAIEDGTVCTIMGPEKNSGTSCCKKDKEYNKNSNKDDESGCGNMDCPSFCCQVGLAIQNPIKEYHFFWNDLSSTSLNNESFILPNPYLGVLKPPPDFRL